MLTSTMNPQDNTNSLRNEGTARSTAAPSYTWEHRGVTAFKTEERVRGNVSKRLSGVRIYQPDKDIRDMLHSTLQNT